MRLLTSDPRQCKRGEQWDRSVRILREHFAPRRIKAYWSNYDQEILFRDPRGPKVTFYPSTGRWLVSGARGAIQGGAKAFIHWYMKRFA